MNTPEKIPASLGYIAGRSPEHVIMSMQVSDVHIRVCVMIHQVGNRLRKGQKVPSKRQCRLDDAVIGAVINSFGTQRPFQEVLMQKKNNYLLQEPGRRETRCTSDENAKLALFQSWPYAQAQQQQAEQGTGARGRAAAGGSTSPRSCAPPSAA